MPALTKVNTARKATVVAITGLTTWCATFLPAIWAGLIGVLSATVLVFLTPNAPEPSPWDPPVRDAGQSTLRLVVLLLAAAALLVWLSGHVDISTH